MRLSKARVPKIKNKNLLKTKKLNNVIQLKKFISQNLDNIDCIGSWDFIFSFRKSLLDSVFNFLHEYLPNLKIGNTKC